MTEKQEALKPCPFCADGGKPKLYHHSSSSHPFVVICLGKVNGNLCNAQLWPSFTQEEAIASWNTRALAEAPKVDGWQPIETAPKDGTEIFLSLWSGHPSRKTSFCWATSGFYKNGNWYSRDPMTGRLVPPSHWMKINPPCEEGDAQ